MNLKDNKASTHLNVSAFFKANTIENWSLEDYIFSIEKKDEDFNT
jgi:hypothetical protein